MNRIENIRRYEKKYHDSCYDTCHLFEPGSWLHKPVKTVLEVLEQFKDYPYFKVLDLGSGIGRNSISIAETMKHRDGKVVCVDLLESAIDKLLTYSKQYGVDPYIEGRLSDIDHFAIEPSEYDLIVAVSSLEHVSSDQALEHKISEMAAGTKPNGVNCIIIGSNVREVEVRTNRELNPMFEVNITTESMLNLLDTAYKGWEIQRRLVKPLVYEIDRDGEPVRLSTDCITYVAQKM